MVIALAIVAVFLSAFKPPRFSSQAMGGLLGITICFFPTMYTIYSYAIADNVRLYLTLPIRKGSTVLSFCLALFAYTLLERIAFIIVVLLFLFENPLPIIAFLLVSGFVTVLLSVLVQLGINSKRPFAYVMGFLLFAALATICLFVQVLIVQLGLAAIIGGVSIVLMLRHDSLDLAVFRQGAKTTGTGRNYFFSVLLSEKMYLLNTAMVMAFAGIFLFAFAERGNPIMVSVAWCVAAVNTPVTTMLSGDKWLVRQAEMLPDQHRAVMGMYRRFLVVYYLVTNTVVLALTILHAGDFKPYLLIQFAIVVLLEVILVSYLETKKRIIGWQTKQQLWRNPRKYIMPAIVFIVCCAIGMMAAI